MKINNLSYLFVAGALALASCSHDEYTGPDIAGSKLIVNGAVNGHSTRASNASWEPGDEIGISSDGGHDNVHFSTSKGDGVFESETPTYILGAGETNFTSYYPHHEAASATTPELSFTEPKDFMFATATASRENPVASFKFDHVMSKISLKISDSQAVAGTTGTIKLDGLAVSGKFHTLTGEVTPDTKTGSITQDFTPNSTVEFIVPPVSGSVGNVSVVINYNDKVYGGSLDLNSLESGTDYQFSTELNAASEAGELSISSATINDWNKTEGGNVDMEEKEPEREPNTLEVGDFLLADGTTLDKNDATVDQYKSQIVGVVYYVGNPQPSSLYGYAETQDILKKNHPTATNGLAIAINNANDGNSARLQSAKYAFSTWYQSDSKDSSTANPNYIGTNLSLTKVGERMLGYNNTQVIKAATAEVGGDNTATGAEDLVNLIAAYNSAKSVTNASEWYLPSYAELAAVMENYNVVKASVEKAGGELTAFPDYTKAAANELFYWTSDFRGSDNAWVNPLVSTEEDLFVGKNSNGTKGYFRLSIAF